MNQHLYEGVIGLVARAERLVARARAETHDILLDLALSAVYPARGAAELLREASKKSRISVAPTDLDALFEKHVPNWRLVWAVRVQDFHKAGLSRGPGGVLATVPAQATIAIDLSEPPRARLISGGADAERDVFVWAPPYVQVGASAQPIPILDALSPYLAGMRELVQIIRAAA